MKRKPYAISVISLLLISAPVVAACGQALPANQGSPAHTTHAPLPIAEPPSSEHIDIVPVLPVQEPVKKPSLNISSQTDKHEEEADEQNETVEQPVASDKPAQPEAPVGKSVEADQPALKPITEYTATQPRLMGYQIHDPKSSIVLRYGEPKHKYPMNDHSGQLIVYQYEGFMVGFTNTDTVEFINVTSANANPGLNGLHVGQTAEEAIKLLGAPGVSNTYIMVYQNADAVLKLDIDPRSHTILSIKLFPSE